MDSKVTEYLSKLQSALFKQYENGDFTDAILVTGFDVSETR